MSFVEEIRAMQQKSFDLYYETMKIDIINAFADASMRKKAIVFHRRQNKYKDGTHSYPSATDAVNVEINNCVKEKLISEGLHVEDYLNSDSKSGFVITLPK